MVVSVCVGPFENFTALNDCFAALLQEFEFFGRIALSLMELNALLFDDWKKFNGKLARTVMVSKSLIVPHVTLQLSFGAFSFGLLVGEPRVFLLLLVQVAFVVASGCRSVAFPIAHAHPTEFIAALRASHVVASLVLFDISLALWTALRVC